MKREPATAPVTPHGIARSLGAPWARVDGYLILAVGVAAFLLARWYLPVYRSGGGVPFFYQQEFGPAVMSACGRGFVNPDATEAPELQAFLDQHADQFQCADLRTSLQTKPLDAFQGFSRYLMMAAATTWRATGVNWKGIDLLTAAMFAVSIAAAYTTIRFVGGRGLSLLVTLLWATSTWHLQNLPHLRDYSKVPFFVLMLVAVGIAFVERRMSWLVPLGIAFGVVQGLGYGMRADVAFNFIPFLVVLFLGAPEPFRNIAPKLACAAAAIAIFILVALPIHAAYQDNGSLWHVVLLGLTSPYDANLHLGLPLPPYNFGYKYHDGYIEAVVGAYWARFHSESVPIILGSLAYGAACRDYFFALARTFPGDMLTRMVASALHVFNLPFSIVYGAVPLGVTNPVFVVLSEWRSWLMQSLENTGALIVAGVLVLIGLERLRYACVAFVLLWEVAAYPSLQYQWRHIFQLEFLVLGVMACGFSLARRSLRAVNGMPAQRVTVARFARSIATVGGLFVAVGVALAIARAVQVPQARALLASYAAAPLDPLPASVTQLPDGQVRVAADAFGAMPLTDGVHAGLLVADFAFDQCGPASSTDVTFRYSDRDAGRSDFSWTTRVPLSPGTARRARVFLPVYSVRRRSALVSEFEGVEVPAAVASCLTLFRLRDVAALPPILLPVTGTPDWIADRLYQRIPLERAVPPLAWRWMVRLWPRVSQLG